MLPVACVGVRNQMAVLGSFLPAGYDGPDVPVHSSVWHLLTHELSRLMGCRTSWSPISSSACMRPQPAQHRDSAPSYVSSYFRKATLEITVDIVNVQGIIRHMPSPLSRLTRMRAKKIEAKGDMTRHQWNIMRSVDSSLPCVRSSRSRYSPLRAAFSEPSN